MGKLISLIFILVFGWGSGSDAAQLSQAQIATRRLKSFGQTCPVLATCGSRIDLATKACLSSLSPHISTAAAVAGGLLTLSSTMSTSDACKEKGKTLDKVNQLLALYNTACGAAILACKSACTKAAADVTPFTLCSTCGTTFSADITNAMKVCEGFNLNLAAGGAAIFAIIQQSNVAKQCEKDTTVVCAPGDTRPACAQVNAAQLDCSLAANAQKPECICQRSPNQAGCPGGGLGGGTGGVGSLQSNSSASAAGSGLGNLDIEGGFESKAPDVRGANGTGSGGGSNGSDSGSGADGGAAATKPTEAAKRMNTNILGGSDGGGGGGGGRRGSASSDDSFRSSSLGAFLPGGAKDPNRGVASGGAAAAGISGAGGKSNWQKVNERYIDNRSEFLGDGP